MTKNERKRAAMNLARGMKPTDFDTLLGMVYERTGGQLSDDDTRLLTHAVQQRIIANQAYLRRKRNAAE